MRSPFPGMDPYLEHPSLWPEIHTRLIVALADMLGPVLRPRYRVAIEQRTYVALLVPEELVGLPDLAVVETEPASPTALGMTTARFATPLVAEVPLPEERRERYLEVRAVVSGKVITAIEILSPSNKQPGEGRRAYEEKRNSVLGSQTHLVEVDLLRGGQPMPIHLQSRARGHGYRILVSRFYSRPRAALYYFSVREPIPVFPLPLQRGDSEPALDLGVLLHDLYERAGYDLVVNYRQTPVPPLDRADAVWAERLLRKPG